MLKIDNGLGKDVEKLELQSFIIDDDLFSRMQEYVQKNNIKEGTYFRVLDKTGKQLFLVTYLEDLIAGIRRKDLSDYSDRCKNIENLDFTLLDQYHKFLFLEVDNYSVAIAKLLQQHCPNKKIIFGDVRARYFFADRKVKCLSRFCDAGRYMRLIEEWMRGAGNASFGDRVRAFAGWKILGMLKKRKNICIVKSDRRNHPDENSAVYNSQNVIYSLLWKKQKRCFGGKNKDKTLVVLDYSCDNEGMGSITKCAFAHYMWLSRNGYVPVMNLSKFPNQYLAAEGENMWEYFFEPVTSVSVEEAYQSQNVIVAGENDISWCDFHINPYQRAYMEAFGNREEFRRIIRINQETKAYIERKMPKEIRDGKRVLGVVARGTDFRNAAAVMTNKTWRENVVEIDRLIEVCSDYKEKYNYDYVYVATEDSEYFDKFKERFGEALLSVSQKRVAYDYENGEFKSVRELLSAEDGKIMGRDYLTGVWSLTGCTALLYNVECGAVRLAYLWKQGDFERFQCIGAGAE